MKYSFEENRCASHTCWEIWTVYEEGSPDMLLCKFYEKLFAEQYYKYLQDNAWSGELK